MQGELSWLLIDLGDWRFAVGVDLPDAGSNVTPIPGSRYRVEFKRNLLFCLTRDKRFSEASPQ